MKAITMRIQKFSRPGVILLATVVAIITSIVVANATQTITTPNAAFFSYTLAPGANSAAITPANERAALVMGWLTQTYGVGQVTLHHVPGTPGAISWVGLESTYPAAITQGFTSTAGTHIVYINLGHDVEIQMASGDTIRVHNGSTATTTGNVTLIW
jgi:hypothetical protein